MALCVCDPIRLAVLVQCRLVTDRQTDKRTDRHTDAQTHDDSIYRASTAYAVKSGGLRQSSAECYEIWPVGT